MSLKTLGARTFAALAFGAVTLHGLDTVTPPVSQAVASPASGSGASRRAFGLHQGVTAPQVFDVPKAMVDRSEEEILAIILAEAARIYYT